MTDTPTPAPAPAAPAPAAPARPSLLKRIGKGALAAITSPTAVKQERSLAALVICRVLLATGASAGLAELIAKLVHG